MKVISVIKDGAVIDKILDHLQYKFEVLPLSARPPPRARSYCESDFPLDPPLWTESNCSFVTGSNEPKHILLFITKLFAIRSFRSGKQRQSSLDGNSRFYFCLLPPVVVEGASTTVEEARFLLNVALIDKDLWRKES